MKILAANNANSIIVAAVSPTATTIQVAAGANFPTPVQGESYFLLTLIDASSGMFREIVQVTAVSGTTLTVTRGQEGTAPRNWAANDIAANLMTKGTIEALLQWDDLSTKGTAGKISTSDDGVSVQEALNDQRTTMLNMQTDLTIAWDLATAALPKADANDQNITMSTGGTLKEAVYWVTIEQCGGSVDIDDNSAAILLASQTAAALGVGVVGKGEYKVGSTLSLSAGAYKNIALRPSDNYSGPGPDFVIPAVSGKLTLDHIDVSNFVTRGARILRGSYGGTPSVYGSSCRFNNNGSLLRTSTLISVNTATDITIQVSDISGFVIGDYVWVGDTKMMILTLSGQDMTFVNDGSAPTRYSGGTGTGVYKAGQYVTRDGNGKNGLTVGDGQATFNVFFTGDCQFNNNGWFGLFNWANTAPDDDSTCHIQGCEGSGNGFIGIGMGKLNSGVLFGNTCENNGNNGIDVNKAPGSVIIQSNNANHNGVDGIFTGCYDTGPDTVGNVCSGNFRIGILYSGDSQTCDVVVRDNTLIDNEKYGVCMTGVTVLAIRGNTFGGTSVQHVRVEGRDDRLNPNPDISNNVFLTEASGYDIFCNLGGYVNGGVSGKIALNGNRYSVNKPGILVSSFDISKSSFCPEYFVNWQSSYTASSGGSIPVTLTAYKPYNTALIENMATLANLQLTTTSQGTIVAPATSATRNAGLEIANSATGSGKVVCAFNYGVITYSFVYNTAGTRYLQYSAGGNKNILTLEWT